MTDLTDTLVPQWYRAGFSPQEVPAAAFCSGAPILNSPISLTVAAARPGDASTAHGTALTLASVGIAASFSVVARDAFGNNASSDPSRGYIWLSNATLHPAALQCLTFNSTASNASAPAPGVCSAGFFDTSAHVYASERAGSQSLLPMQHRLSYTATISAHYSHLVQAFQPGGLRAQYYAGDNFEGPPLVSRVDEELEFSWLEEDVTTHAGLPLSVRWSGVLLPDLNESYTLTLRASGGSHARGVGGQDGRDVGGARVWLQGKLAMELEGSTARELRETRVEIAGNRCGLCL
jgi:hypothetical protein